MTTLNAIRVPEHQNGLLGDAERHRRNGAVRRVAVVRLTPSHFKLVSTRRRLDS